MYRKIIKPFLDVSLSFFGLLTLSPLIIIVVAILSILNRGKVFFRQERPGYLAEPFYVYKFKTMTDEMDSEGKLLPNHMRTTKFGSFLRKSSLDEIPQLFNVVKGEMSLVGPRPLLFKYVALYSKEQSRRHDVKPGITGLAQVSGRNSITWTEKFKHDVYYSNNISFLLDMKILRLTIFKVLGADGVNASETVTSQPFNGKN